MNSAGSRRDRVRAATMTEIHDVARQLLVENGPDAITLRAIAREMGMTAPALYRYYDSREALVHGMIGALLDDLSDHLEAARDAEPADDLPARLTAMARALRAWALKHPTEFRLAFTTPIEEAQEKVGSDGGYRFGSVFLELFAQMIDRGLVRVPEPERIPPAIAEQLSRSGNRLTHKAPVTLPPGGVFLFVTSWTRLYGQICMEVFGQVAWCLTDAEPLFELTLAELAEQFGMPAPAARSAIDSAPRQDTAEDHQS